MREKMVYVPIRIYRRNFATAIHSILWTVLLDAMVAQYNPQVAQLLVQLFMLNVSFHKCNAQALITTFNFSIFYFPNVLLKFRTKIIYKRSTVSKWISKENTNPYTLEWMIRNNIMDCQSFLSPYDTKWFGKFTYRDRHNNKKFNEVLQSKYGRK